jgi:arabinose-5-phosphate isomerase
MELRGFQPEHFARFHPGGSLGRRLLSKVSDEMISDDLPIVSSNAQLADVINVMSKGALGVALVTDDTRLVAIITDGDLRRAMAKYDKSLFDFEAKDIAIGSPVTISPMCSMEAGYNLMQKKKINSLVVCLDGKLVGVLKK